MKYDDRTIPLESVQQDLANDELLVTHYDDLRHIVSISVSKDSSWMSISKKPADFNSNVQDLIGWISEKPDLTLNLDSLCLAFNTASNRVFTELVSEAIGLDSIPMKLIIIPEGQLCYLPFELLTTKDNSSVSDFRDLPTY